MIAATVSEEYRCLVEILTCLVCKGIVQQAHICPNCSKFYCLNCIHQQLAIEEKCLNCNRFLDPQMLTNCQQLCSELTETLQRVKIRGLESRRVHQDKSPYYCYRHKLQKTYYCKTCNIPLCSDCSVLTEMHRGHQFIKLSLMRTQFRDKMGQVMAEIAHESQGLSKQIERLSQQSSCKQNVEHDTLLKVQSSMNSLKEQLKKKLKKILKEGEKQLNGYNEALEEWNQCYEREMKILRQTSQGKFVEQEFGRLQLTLLKMVEEAQVLQKQITHTNEEINKQNIPFNYIYPGFNTFTFIIEQFSNKRKSSSFIYTDAVTTEEGLQWRLKIYPKGLSGSAEINSTQDPKLTKKNSKNQQYLAIFIELVGGPVTNTKQRHQIILKNQIHEGRPFLREFENEFEVGCCWGYENFMRLSQLYEEGYYSKQLDCVQVCLSIGPASYSQGAKDQLGFIRAKEEELLVKKRRREQLQGLISKECCSTSSQIEIQLNA